MGLRSFLQRKRAPVGSATGSPALTAAAADPLTPAQLVELRQAWDELTEAARASGATGFHACSRNGKPWQEDVATVKALASILRNLPTEETGPDAQPGR